MARRRTPDLEGRSLVLDRQARAEFQFAAFHGVVEDGGAFHPPESDRRPPRAWLAALYDANRTEMLAEWDRVPWSRLSAWPVAEFDHDPALRARAEEAIAWERARHRAVMRSSVDLPTPTPEPPAWMADRWYR